MKVLDLFCGAGGFSEGFRQAGFEIVAGTDLDPDACATYAVNFPGAVTACGDLTAKKVRAQVVEAAKGVEIVVGGPPCQAFSQVRNHDRNLDDPRNQLYREFLRLLKLTEPSAFVMENVPGLAQLRVQERISSDLSLSGQYRVSVQKVDACDFGVPQTRKRILFLGIHSSLGTGPLTIEGSGASENLILGRGENGSVSYRPTLDGQTGDELLEKLAQNANESIVTVSQAISDLSFLEAGRRLDTAAADDLPVPGSAYQERMRDGLGSTLQNISVPRINDDTVLRLSAIPPGGNYLDLPDELQERYLTGQKWGPHNGSGRLGRLHYYAYRRLHPDFWAWTLNTKADSAYHWETERALSVREFARLQSFPDRFVFTTDSRKGDIPGRITGGPAHSRYRQAGNAVPPLMARTIAEAILAAFQEQEYPELSEVAV